MKTVSPEIQKQLDSCGKLAEELFLKALRPILLDITERMFPENRVPNYLAMNTEIAWNCLCEIALQMAYQEVPLEEMRQKIKACISELNFRAVDMLEDRLKKVVMRIQAEKSETARKQ